MVWWSWIILGLALVAAEVLLPTDFFFLFFGFAALVIGGLAGVGAVESAPLQWLLFSLVAAAALVFVRGPLLTRFKGTTREAQDVDSMVGETALALDDIPPGGVGKAELRGSTWNARNGAQTGVSKGQRTRVERVDGLTLWIRPE
jgi:membrane protein implicated in regulation of membrane protease activity